MFERNGIKDINYDIESLVGYAYDIEDIRRAKAWVIEFDEMGYPFRLDLRSIEWWDWKMCDIV